MVIDFKKLVLSKSNNELQEYLDKRRTYVPQAVEAAISEMQKRGRTFSDEELATIRQELQQQQEVAEKFENESRGWGKNVVKDESAPAFYSEGATYTFTILFSAFFGAVLLATNFRETESQKGRVEVISFGIGFTALQIWILSMIPRNTGLTFLFSGVGAIILNKIFWKKYIGADTKYRARPIWKPLIIGIAITVLIIYVAISSGTD